MRVTISHSKSKTEAMAAVDRAMQDLFGGAAMGPLTLVDARKSWNGSVMSFSVTAAMGLLKNPIAGTVEVTDREVIIDADLGLLGKLMPERGARSMLESRMRKLLT